MKKIPYENDAHKALAGKLYGEYLLQFSKQQDAVLLNDFCWITRFLAMITREENWIHFHFSYDARGSKFIVDLVKWGYMFPGNFKMPVHDLTRKKKIK